MTNKSRLILVFALIAFATMACFITDTVGSTVGNAVGNAIGGDTVFTTQGSLWADVPQMDGLVKSDLDIPLAGKLLLQTMMSQILAEGKGGADWIAFTTQKTSADLTNFYTNELMATNGWEATDSSTCLSGSDQGVAQVGAFCIFAKQEGIKDIGLMVIAIPDDKDSAKTNVFFIRIESQDTTPTP